MSKTDCKRTMQQILTAAGYSPRAYSGRGMGGETCLAVDGDTLGSLFANVLETLDSEENEIAAHAFRGVRTDNLGLGAIVYFPSIAFVE